MHLPMKDFLLIPILLCFFTTVSFTQVTINDGAFESGNWVKCDGTSPQIATTAGHATDITGTGNFLILTASATGEATQSVSTGITGALVPNNLYYFDVELVHPAKYKNDSQTLDGYGYLEIYGSMTSCGEDQLLWCSGPVCNATWQTYTVVFQPAQAYKFIKFKTKTSAGCTGPGKTAIIAVDNISAVSTITGTVTNATCGTPKSGYIQLSQALPDPILPAYKIMWSNGTTTNYTNLANVDPGDYILTITNPLCTAGGGAFKWKVAGGNFTASVTKTDITCGGAANSGTATVVATGTGPYTYTWSHSAAVTGAIANNLPAGTYTCTVKEAASGCYYAVVFDIIQAVNNVTLDLSAKTDVNCYGESTGSATVKVSPSAGNYTYSWNTMPAQLTTTAANLKAGTYSVTVTDAGGCTKLAAVTITQNPEIQIGIPVIKTPTCGSQDGEADISGVVTGGVGPYTYLWNTTPVQTTAKLTGVAAGNYQVKVTDSKCCTKTKYIVIANTTGPTVTTSTKNVTCTGAKDGSATATVTNSTGTVTYEWSTTPKQTAATATGLAGGTYTVIIKDASTCSITKVVTIDEAATLLSPAVTVAPSTCGGKNGTATVAITGGKAPFQYTWNTTPPQTTATISNLAGGTYQVTVTDDNGCIKTATAVIDASTALVVKTDSTQASCGKASGSASVIVSGGVEPYHYTWLGVPAPQDLPTINNLLAGIYTVTVTDSKNCSKTVSVTVVDASAMIIDITTQPATCGQKNGAAAAKIRSGGIAPYTYSWNTVPEQKNATATDLAPGNYIITVTDSKGCSQAATVTIAGSTALKLTLTTTPAACNQTDGSATATVTGGSGTYTYNWSTTPAQTTAAATNLAAGAYILTVADNQGCKKDTTVTITTTSGLSLTVTSKNITCRGDANGSITPKVAGGTGTVNLTLNGVAIASGSTTANLGAGIYRLEATDGAGCKATSAVTFVNPEELIIAVASTKASCGASNGTVTAKPAGGIAPYIYSWNTTPAQTTLTASGLSAGNYTVIVTDANGCSKINNATVSSSSQLQLSASPVPTSCGLPNGKGAVIISGGDGPFNYEWSPAPIQTSAVATNLKPGTYTVKVIDANGCSKIQTVTIEPSKAPQVFIDIPVKIKCAGAATGSATATGNGGSAPYTYVWNTTPPQTGATLQNVIAGTYVVTMTDIGPCTTMATVKIEEYPKLKLDTSTTVSKCAVATGTATIKASGGLPGVNGYTYKWSTNPVQTTPTAVDLPAGTYTVIVTDDNNCTVAATAIVKNANLPVVSITETIHVNCFGAATGSATAIVKGGVAPFEYTWNTNPEQKTNKAIGLIAGTYSVKVTDNELCTAAATVTITQPPQLKVTIKDTSHVKCNGGSNGSAVAVATGGVAPYTYKWSDAFGQQNDTVIGLPVGIYTVVVTDAKGCTGTASVTIKQPDSIKTSFTNVLEDMCNAKKGAATVVATGGFIPYTYLWNTTPVQNAATATGLGAGYYVVTVTDKNKCVKIDSVEIKATSSLKIKIDSTKQVTCFGFNNGSAFVKVISGGKPGFTFTWNTLPQQTTQKAVNLKPGSYTVTVIDTSGCIATDSVKITEPQKLLLKIDSVIHPVCYGMPVGSAYVAASEGTKPYTYEWNSFPVQTTPKATQLLAGNYMVTVTDSNQCVDSAKVTIKEGRKITVKPQKEDTVCTGHTITLKATGANGIAPYIYIWKPAGPVVTPTQTEIYKVIAIDSSGCVSDTQRVRIVVRPPIFVNPIPVEQVCVGKSIKLIAHAIGGDGKFDYLWLPSKQTTPEITVTPAGTTLYSVIVTDGCKSISDTAVALVVVDALPEIAFTADKIFGCAPVNVAFTNISKNTSPYPTDIVWNFGDDKGPSVGSPNVHLFDAPGKYTVSLSITDSNRRCKNTKVVDTMITVYPVPEASFASSERNVSILEAKICFTNYSSGGNYFVWDFGDPKDAINNTSTEESPCHMFNDTGYYCVKLKTLNNYGCYDTLVYCVYVHSDFVMYLPNAFTPSSSKGTNDYFGPQGIGFDESRFKMFIFDRSGSVIYQTNSLSQPWDGSVNGGGVAPSGVYIYQINCFDTRGNEYVKTGTVTVIR
jgi:gliding motility-associated-like protein